MSNKPKIKILVAYHSDNDIIIRSDIFQPIQVGSAISAKKIEGIFHDDDGENISHLNRSFCELTAIYWAWKNLDKLDNPDYVGLFHYRRHFAFWEKFDEASIITPWYFDKLNSDYIEQARVKDTYISKFLKQYDVIVPVILPQENGLSNHEQYLKYHSIDDFDMTIEILLHKYPEYQDVVNEYLHSNKTHFFNMSIMRADIFIEYADWLFDILFTVNRNIDIKYYSRTESRIIGYLAERLTSIFIFKLQATNKYKIKNLPVTMIHNTKMQVTRLIYPAFEMNNIAIVLSANDLYAPYLCVTIQSILNNINLNYNYDILIFNIDISQENKHKILNHITFKNVSIRFVQVDIDVSLLEQKIATSDIKHISPDSMSRLLIPQILINYTRVMYIDVDLIVCGDISGLYFSSEFDDFPIVGTPDIAMRAAINARDEQLKEYLMNKLELSDIYTYLQAGVLLFNINKISKNQARMLQDAIYQNWKYFDQCILNRVFNSSKGFFNLSWNFTVLDGHGNNEKERLLSLMPAADANFYLELEKTTPNIVHYVGGRKPWFYPQNYFAGLWWKIARETYFYEEIILKMVEHSKLEIDLISSNIQKNNIWLSKIKANHYLVKIAKYKSLLSYNMKTNGIKNTCKKVLQKFIWKLR